MHEGDAETVSFVPVGTGTATLTWNLNIDPTINGATAGVWVGTSSNFSPSTTLASVSLIDSPEEPYPYEAVWTIDGTNYISGVRPAGVSFTVTNGSTYYLSGGGSIYVPQAMDPIGQGYFQGTVSYSRDLPTLGITNVRSTGVTVYWPAAYSNFSLQWTSALNSPIAWTFYSNAPSLSSNGSNLVVSVASLLASNPRAFFQLVFSNEISGPIGPVAPLLYTGPITSAPGVATETANDLEATSAQLNGTVQADGLQTTYWFEWGLTTAYGQTTSAGVIGASETNSVSVGAYAFYSMMTSNTTYHFQLFASNSDGISSGGDLTFTAPAQPGMETHSDVASTLMLLIVSITVLGIAARRVKLVSA